jgi:hypothetical protein
MPSKRCHTKSRRYGATKPLLLLSILFFADINAAFEFQHDFDAEQCARGVEKCTTTNDMWYKCPISCSKHLEEEGAMAEERSDPEQFYLLETTNRDGKIISLEDNEGYVTLFAALPLLPGMAPFYYDVIEHIAEVYKYTLVPMIFPITIEGNSASLDSLPHKAHSKTILLENGSSSNSVLQYLLTRQVVAGNQALELTLDRPTIFLVSHTGMYIEQLPAPTMELLERRIKVHEWAMTKEDL